MHDCLFKLLRSCDEDSLECLCQLLMTIGQELDNKQSKVPSHRSNICLSKSRPVHFEVTKPRFGLCLFYVMVSLDLLVHVWFSFFGIGPVICWQIDLYVAFIVSQTLDDDSLIQSTLKLLPLCIITGPPSARGPD